jgi:hypothetical protein
MSVRNELSGAFGPIDSTALTHIRTLFCETEPLVNETEFDDPIAPTVLHVHLTTGFGSSGRFDIRWSEYDYYSIHYTEPDLDWRFDRHPNPHSLEKHFHPPPNAPSKSAVRSCIEVERPELVALAVSQCWRDALETDDPSILNDADNPP